MLGLTKRHKCDRMRYVSVATCGVFGWAMREDWGWFFGFVGVLKMGWGDGWGCGNIDIWLILWL